MDATGGRIRGFAAVVVSVARMAAADEKAPDAATLLDLGSLSETRQAGIELGIADVPGERTILTLVLVADVNVSRHFKLHGRLPFFAARSAAGTEKGAGNPEVGGRFTIGRPVGGGTLRLGVGMAGSVPAGSEGGEMGAATSIPWRIAEWAPDTFGLRVDTGLGYEVGWGFAQLEAGFDNLLRTGGDDLALASLLELGAAAGVHATRDVTVVGEVLAVSDALRGSGGRADWLPALAFGARYGGARVAVAGKVHVPLGDRLSGYPIGFRLDVLASL